MKKYKLGILIAAIFACFAGCSAEPKESESAESETVLETVPKSHSSSQAEQKDKKTIVWYLKYDTVNPGIAESDKKSHAPLHCEVYDQLNELLEEKGFDFEIEFRTINPSEAEEYDNEYESEQMKQLMDNKAQADIFQYNAQTEDMLFDFTELLNSENGTRLKESYEDIIWKSLETRGKNYYVFNNSLIQGKRRGYAWNRDFVEKYQISEEEQKLPLNELDPVLKRFKEQEGKEPYPMKQWWNRTLTYGDYAYINLDSLFVIPQVGENPHIEIIYKNDDFISQFKLMRDYCKKGYSAKADMNESALLQEINYTFPEYEKMLEEKTNTIRIPKGTAYIADDLRFSSSCIASWSQNPEKAFEVLTAVMTDPEISNLLNYGIEGKNYKVENERVVPCDKIGENMEAVAGSYYSLGNDKITYSAQNQVLDKSNQYHEYTESLEGYDAMGFKPDFSNAKKEYAECKKIVDSHMLLNASIWTGTINDVEKELDKINRELEQAGVQKVLDELNRQLDEFYQSGR